ncbi:MULTISPECIES: alpha/beta hydrolase [Nocardiaceae]|uniref:alpha/beta hydrolase n=1 Tax=Nocardiaceae TaxID=85025 RepID=UPI00068CBAB2|nr:MULTISPECIES: alpha/beta fold hydrolase [Rhodococcus]MBY4215195.1 alpha/beta fold hydrolase [Rhodococcus fascians]MBY4240812.1 alpha/beta fold hydrolase [Rhodococcus fascians]MBY4256332.1 alpha/beta fold hydrolase [Rhodococcus fascians]MBY4272059.1 alpha/beta fold hydrolase [Rhodococcus fascians]MDJ0409482.1 alpha/beta hydrolase [Rhodococcus fascians]
MMRTRGLLAGLAASMLLLVGAGTAAAAPINVPWSPDDALDSEVSFESGGVTFYGSLRMPVGDTRGVALVLPGSGPTDRNGNSGDLHLNTTAYVADELSRRGIASLRFDKLGSGRTGLAGVDPNNPPGFDAQVDNAADALAFLQQRTGVGADRTTVIGHSEGALTALRLADADSAAFTHVGLLEPLSIRYLDLLTAQVDRNIGEAVAVGQFTEEQAASSRDRFAQAVADIRAGQPLSAEPDPIVDGLGLRQSATFLREADATDPADLAAALPDSYSSFLTCSDKDLNVSCGQVENVRVALGHTDLHFAHFANSSHMLGELGPLPADPNTALAPLPLSGEFRDAFGRWVDGL